MTKTEAIEHHQKLINLYNHQLDEIEREITKGAGGIRMQLLDRRRKLLIRKLMKLYDTEKYGAFI